MLAIWPKKVPKITMPMTGSQSMWKKVRRSYDSESAGGANHSGSWSAMPLAMAASLRMKNWFHNRPLNGMPMAAPAMKKSTKISGFFRVFWARLATSINRMTVTHWEAEPILSIPASRPM